MSLTGWRAALALATVLYDASRLRQQMRRNVQMTRRGRRSYTRRGPSPFMWVNGSGILTLAAANRTSWVDLLTPAEWSGTVTEQKATLVRIVLQLYAGFDDAGGLPMAQNIAIVVGNMLNSTSNFDSDDISNPGQFPDFFAKYDDCLYFGRLEFPTGEIGVPALLVQYSQLPEPVINLKRPRKLEPDDTVRLAIGGQFSQVASEHPVVYWFTRILVRIR